MPKGPRAPFKDCAMTAKQAARFMAKVAKGDGTDCWEWTDKLTPGGYGRLGIGSKAFAAHRLSWRHFHGPIPDGFVVCHICDNRSCVNPGHLFVGKQRDNVMDMFAKGRAANVRGERHPQSKLTTEIVLWIRRELAKGRIPKDIAKGIGVCTSTVSHVKHGRVWSHVPQESAN